MKKTALTLALVASAVLGMTGAAHAQTSTYLGVQFADQKLTVENESESEAFSGFYGGIKVGMIGYEAAFSQRTISGVTVRIIDTTVNPHFAINDKAAFVAKAGMRNSSVSVDNVSVSGTSLLLGAGLEYQLTPKVAGRVMYDYAPRTFGEKIKNTSLSAGVAYTF